MSPASKHAYNRAYYAANRAAMRARSRAWYAQLSPEHKARHNAKPLRQRASRTPVGTLTPLGRQIAAYCAQQGITQRHLAQQLGCTAQTITNIKYRQHAVYAGWVLQALRTVLTAAPHTETGE